MSDISAMGSMDAARLQESVAQSVLKEAMSQAQDAKLAVLLESTVVAPPDPNLGNSIDVTA